MVKHFNTIEELVQYYRECANKVFSDITVNVKEVKPKFKIGDYVEYTEWSGEYKIVDIFFSKKAKTYFYLLCGFATDNPVLELTYFAYVRESEMKKLSVVSNMLKHELSTHKEDIKLSVFDYRDRVSRMMGE